MVIDPVSVHRHVSGTGRNATEHLQRGMSEVCTERLARRLGTLRDRVETGMDRREFLRTVVSGGVAVGMAQWLGVDDFLAVDDGEVPVVTALVRDDPNDPWSVRERTRSVPAEWYAAVEKAFELNDLLARTAFTGYLGSAVVPGDYESGTATVSVGLSSDGHSLTEMLGEVAAGIDIDAETIIDIEEIQDGPESREPTFVDAAIDGGVPSGVACETPSSMATLGPALYDPDVRQRFFVTADHAFGEEHDAADDVLLLPRAGDEPVELGTAVRYHPVEDVAAVEPNGWLEPTNRIAAPSQPRVRGQFTKFGLADLVARDEELEKVGALSGHTTGKIQGIDAVTCFTDDFCRRGQIRWGGEMDLTDGDSGSVSYHRDPDGEDGDVLVAGFNNARTWWPGQSYVWGVGAYRLTEKHGYHF
ncbi:hypothetical protein [Natrinema gari]|uniref:Uncharacterized protein n=1 Tax=Natrinema gari JCM 14663 TaxID=1230459 RepID=L9YSJ8_9EURY|nr:hypothetical protein [Natrinema gari]ELY77084.1 hypothetical protein C486_16575 [Natrinema gari JCM 14663]